ncbi:hypothetical protein [Limosilactobacillus antri]|uniref:hypothetical protein n=1 Tax=Limosilactobacillus antri TaxID=227943 RepID=UPI001F57FCE9|nr:hypothetical protein [Limosilactobacillus antri]
MNQVVGKTMPSEVYDLTPKELDYILAGAYQRDYERLIDLRGILGNTPIPVGLVGSKYDDGEFKESMQKRQESIKAITDEKLQSKLAQQQKQQQRFIDLLMPDRKGGRS